MPRALRNVDMSRYWQPGANGGGMYVATPDYWNERASVRENNRLRGEEIQRSHDRWMRFGKIAGLGIPAGAAVLAAYPALAGGAAAGSGAASSSAAAPAAASGVATGTAGSLATTVVPGAATAGRMATIGRLFNSAGMNLGVNAGLSLIGMHQQNKAANQARADMLAQNREALALERQRLEVEARNADLDREDARQLNEAINELRRRELEAAEEERAFNRSLIESRETRLQPYRAAGEQALRRLQSMWGLA